MPWCHGALCVHEWWCVLGGRVQWPYVWNSPHVLLEVGRWVVECWGGIPWTSSDTWCKQRATRKTALVHILFQSMPEMVCEWRCDPHVPIMDYIVEADAHGLALLYLKPTFTGCVAGSLSVIVGNSFGLCYVNFSLGNVNFIIDNVFMRINVLLWVFCASYCWLLGINIHFSVNSYWGLSLTGNCLTEKLVSWMLIYNNWPRQGWKKGFLHISRGISHFYYCNGDASILL